jgi:hypothetical protein
VKVINVPEDHVAQGQLLELARHFHRFWFGHDSLQLSGYASHTKITERPSVHANGEDIT